MQTDRAELGVVLRLLRQRQQLSQHQLALDSGLQQRQISFFESGRAQPRLASLQRLATALDLQPFEFQALLRCTSARPDPAAAQTASNHDFQALARAHRWPALICDRLGHIHAVNEALERITEQAGLSIHWPGHNLYAISFSPSGLLPWLQEPAQVWSATKWQALAQADYAPSLRHLFAQLEAHIPDSCPEPQQPGVESYCTPTGRWSFKSWNTQLGATDAEHGGFFVHLLQPVEWATQASPRSTCRAITP